jgi:DNA-binding GntR family transcriptional regulator
MEKTQNGGILMDKKVLLAETLKCRIISMELALGAVVDEVALSEEFGLFAHLFAN